MPAGRCQVGSGPSGQLTISHAPDNSDSGRTGDLELRVPLFHFRHPIIDNFLRALVPTCKLAWVELDVYKSSNKLKDKTHEG